MPIINPPGFLHNLATHTAQVDRLAMAASMVPDTTGLTFRGGVRGPDDYKVTANGTPNMTVNVAAGMCFVKGTQNAFQGLYTVPNDGATNLAITTAHATLPRWDLVVVRIQDTFYSGAVNSATLEVISGTAAASPSDPTVPNNCEVIARVVVAAADTAINTGDIIDLRKWTTAVGGVIPCKSTARPTNIPGQLIYETDTDLVLRGNGVNWKIVYQDTGWVNMTSSITTSRYRVRNGWCCVQLDGGLSIPTNTATTIVTAANGLPVAYRPSVMARSGGYFAGRDGIITAGTDGAISAIQDSGVTTASVSGVINFPIE